MMFATVLFIGIAVTIASFVIAIVWETINSFTHWE